MKMKCILIGLLALPATVFAAALPVPVPVTPQGLLAKDIARPLLERDPGVEAARAGLELALQEANILDRSPYEWTAKAGGQQRRLEEGPRYREWNVGVERTVRLPGKATADRNLGKATVEESQARYGEAMHEAARELLALWLDWLTAEHARELAEGNLQSVQAGLDAVEKRARAGDASRLDANIARGELAEQKRLSNDAKTNAEVAWSRLSVRFPGIPRDKSALPTPEVFSEELAFWRERIVAESDELKLVQAQLEKAKSMAERTRADKIPDPTFGIYRGSEAGGRERITGVTISVPIPGGARHARDAKAIAEVDVLRREVELKTRQLEADIASAVVLARGLHSSALMAIDGAGTMQENAVMTQRAYTLGEADLQTLLLARRQANAAMSSSLQARGAALKAYYGLLLDAHLIWGLEAE